MPIPKPDMSGIIKFHKYRFIKKLEYKEIMILMGKPERTLTRWNKYIKDGILKGKKLSTDQTRKPLTTDK